MMKKVRGCQVAHISKWHVEEGADSTGEGCRRGGHLWRTLFQLKWGLDAEFL